MHSHCRCNNTCSSEISSISSQPTDACLWRHFEQLLFQIQPKNDRKSIRYDLHVKHRTLRTTWTSSLCYHEYHSFVYHRLLPTIQQGHFCDAECPWIYSFVTGTFPKRTTLFSSSGSCVVTCRREALEKCITQVHQYLANKNNYKCRVTQAVAVQFLSFVFGDNASRVIMELEQLGNPFASTGFKLNKSRSSSSNSTISTSTNDPSDEELDCLICNQSLVQTEGCCYTTVLNCGHEFHEECLVAKLNEIIGCPTCGYRDI